MPALRALLAAVLLIGAGGCEGSEERHELTVFAAVSLRQAFTQIARDFETSRSGVGVRLSFGGSQALAGQIREGAPADVFASADVETIEPLPGQAVVFARNRLALLTAPGNPQGIRRLADLGRPELKVVLAGPTVPLGKASAAALRQAGTAVRAVSYEDSASGVVTKVRLGEADAAIAYATDLRGGDGFVLEGTDTELAISALRSGPNAAAFVAFVLGPKGRDVLVRHGFR